MTDPDFLTELHASFEAPRAVVVDLIERATHSSVHELRRLTVGDENEVYQARLSGRSAVYARIRRPGEGTFEFEIWAMGQASSAGVPVPDVLAVDEIVTEVGPRSVMLVAEAPGRQLAELLPALSGPQRDRVLTNVGRVLAVLHTVTTPSVGRPDLHGGWPDAHETRQAFIDERRGQRLHLVTAGLTAAEVQTAVDQIGRSPDTPATADPVLCHGDLHTSHIFVDDDHEVRGIIDWGLWHGGSTIDELGAISMLHQPCDVDAIFAGYGMNRDEHPTLRRRLALSVINQAIGHIAWHESIGNVGGTAHYVQALRTALAEIDDESD